MIDDALYERVINRIERADILAPSNIALLSPLSLGEREAFSRRSGIPVLYLGDEVSTLIKCEEEAALKAAPPGYDLSRLNGVNIGCGGRLVSPYLAPVDIMRQAQGESGEHASHIASAILAAPDDLPFKEASLDLIVALHMLEHIGDPVRMVLYWLSLLKPGGGIGLILPDWRYAWDARNDTTRFGHKWNSSPELVSEIFEREWRGECELEALDTYELKASFDVVLRKPGVFTPFTVHDLAITPSGRELAQSGTFLHKD